MADFVMMYSESKKIQINGAEWAEMLRPYEGFISFNREQLGTRRFCFSGTHEAAEDIRAAYPDLVVEELVPYTTGPVIPKH